jgi:hypothetical protein
MTSHDLTDGMTCDAFAGALAAYLEGELDAGARARVEAHAASCAECHALLADLRSISIEAAGLPLLEPSRDLWDGIAARIEAPVIAMPAAGQRAAVHGRRRWIVPSMAAAALVVVTAGVTYVATRWSMQPPVQVAAVAPAVDTAAEARELGANPLPQAVQNQARIAVEDSIRAVVQVDPPIRPRPSTGPERRSGALLVRDRADDAASAVDSLYGREIARLRTLIAQRGAQLDPTTVQVIEQNLGIIDSAIVRSRAALRRDPASGFLNEQLTSALEKKVELLRTVATLPARTS